MYKKLTFACTFISFLMVISCGKNAWRNVTSIDEVLGEWEGIVSVRHSENPAFPMLKAPVTLAFFIDNNQNYIEGAMYDIEQILDAFVEYSMIDGEVPLTKDELWEMSFPTDYISEDNRESFFEKYYIRIRTTIPFEERDTFDGDNYQIYRSGNRLKWLIGDVASAGFIVEGEVILQRR